MSTSNGTNNNNEDRKISSSSLRKIANIGKKKRKRRREAAVDGKMLNIDDNTDITSQLSSSLSLSNERRNRRRWGRHHQHQDQHQDPSEPKQHHDTDNDASTHGKKVTGGGAVRRHEERIHDASTRKSDDSSGTIPVVSHHTDDVEGKEKDCDENVSAVSNLTTIKFKGRTRTTRTRAASLLASSRSIEQNGYNYSKKTIPKHRLLLNSLASSSNQKTGTENSAATTVVGARITSTRTKKDHTDRNDDAEMEDPTNNHQDDDNISCNDEEENNKDDPDEDIANNQKGYTKLKSGKFQVWVFFNKNRFLGTFENEQDAALAYQLVTTKVQKAEEGTLYTSASNNGEKWELIQSEVMSHIERKRSREKRNKTNTEGDNSCIDDDEEAEEDDGGGNDDADDVDEPLTTSDRTGYYQKKSGKYQALIGFIKTRTIGTFDREEDAALAYQLAKSKLQQVCNGQPYASISGSNKKWELIKSEIISYFERKWAREILTKTDYDGDDADKDANKDDDDDDDDDDNRGNAKIWDITPSGQFRVRVSFGKKRRNIGTYENEQDASLVYRLANSKIKKANDGISYTSMSSNDGKWRLIKSEVMSHIEKKWAKEITDKHGNDKRLQPRKDGKYQAQAWFGKTRYVGNYQKEADAVLASKLAGSKIQTAKDTNKYKTMQEMDEKWKSINSEVITFVQRNAARERLNNHDDDDDDDDDSDDDDDDNKSNHIALLHGTNISSKRAADFVLSQEKLLLESKKHNLRQQNESINLNSSQQRYKFGDNGSDVVSFET